MWLRSSPGWRVPSWGWSGALKFHSPRSRPAHPIATHSWLSKHRFREREEAVSSGVVLSFVFDVTMPLPVKGETVLGIGGEVTASTLSLDVQGDDGASEVLPRQVEQDVLRVLESRLDDLIGGVKRQLPMGIVVVRELDRDVVSPGSILPGGTGAVARARLDTAAPGGDPDPSSCELARRVRGSARARALQRDHYARHPTGRDAPGAPDRVVFPG